MANMQAALEILRAAHPFPGPFGFKVIGENSPDLVARVVQLAVVLLGPHHAPEVALRESRRGRHQAITMAVQLERAEQVVEIYRHLRGVRGVRVLM